MKRKSAFTLLTVAALAYLLVLGACGNNKEESQSPSSSSSSKVVQSSSSSKISSSSKNSSSAKVSSSVSSEDTVVPYTPSEDRGIQSQAGSNSNQVQPIQPTENNQKQATQSFETNRQTQNKQAESNARYKGVLTMVDGDFSAAVGSWTDAAGNTVTVSADGQFTVQSSNGSATTYHIASYAYTLDDGRYTAQLASTEPATTKAGIQIITGADGKVSSVQLLK